MRTCPILAALLCLVLPVSAQIPKIAQSPRELGPIVVSELAIRDSST